MIVTFKTITQCMHEGDKHTHIDVLFAYRLLYIRNNVKIIVVLKMLLSLNYVFVSIIVLGYPESIEIDSS